MKFFNRSDLIAEGRTEVNKSYFSNSSSEILKRRYINFESSKTYDIFLSHSFQDADLILGFTKELEQRGYSVYVDWIEDAQLDRNHVNAHTANQLRFRMKKCKCLLFVSTDNSVLSKWMPWELGYFDGMKGRVAIVPVVTSSSVSDSYKGQEYLGIYDYITYGNVIVINHFNGTQTPLFSWMNGG
ncbi:TIR domain-containing protein [Exiguobacterium sp. s22]|uniref:TIR domain-containing protein n=1 Tax=Exiguobacterium sp. s22 TaxID=2751272 RepID=UPI0020369537|nr:TIR domain-containing protein [Exiguobacterium sp. s22]